MKHQIQDLTMKMVQERYKNAQYSFLFGSATTNDAKEKSDIDVIVVCSGTVMPFREKFRFQGKLMDVFVYDEESLNGALHMSRVNGNFVTCNSVLTAMTLPSPTDSSKKLKDVAERVKKAGYIFQSRAFRQQYLTNILDDLEDCTIPAERNMLCVELYKSVVELGLILGGAGICTRKHASKELTAINAQFQTDLDIALVRALKGNVDFLFEIAMQILNSIGGPVREGFRSSLGNIPRMPLPFI